MDFILMYITYCQAKWINKSWIDIKSKAEAIFVAFVVFLEKCIEVYKYLWCCKYNSSGENIVLKNFHVLTGREFWSWLNVFTI